VKFSSSNRRWIAAAVILLALFLLRPGAARLKSRLITSISSGLGRSVDIGAAHFRLLPRPGFDLSNLVVYDDPAFGAEPMLRASEVTAALRFTSLMRGKIEIARLDLTEPSLNLVRGESGRWNLASLLERTAQIPLAPTAKAKSGMRPGFPYIEATSARINFKSGPEKKPYALINADFSLWQDSENAWGVRVKAQPVRSDLSLNDMGVLRIDGTWQRAASLRETPLEFSIEWDRAQIGQLTKFFTGNDQGWRGGALLELKLSGSPAKLQISNDLSIQDFRRYDVTSGEPLRLATHCDAQYSASDQMFHEIMCAAPVGGGTITLKGDSGLPGSHHYGLALIAERVPASAALALAERAKKNLPEDLAAGGTIRGSVTIDENAASKLHLDGQGEISDFHLTSAGNKAEIGPEPVPFAFASGNDAVYRRARKRATAMRFPVGTRFEIGPFPLGAGRTTQSVVRGWISRSGYSFALAGEAEVGRMLRLARAFGVPALNAPAEGSAQLDIKISGNWPGWGDGTHANFPPAQITGTAKLRNVHATVHGTSGPIEIASADLELASDEVRVQKLKANAANSSWTGSLKMPRGCGAPGACEILFDLTADRIGLGDWMEWANPRPKERPWYRVLETNSQAGNPWMASLRASGRVTTNLLQLHGLAANRASATVNLDHSKLQIADLTAEILGGKHRGTWHADFSTKPTVCSGGGSFSAIALALLPSSEKDAGLAGSGKASYQISGPCSTEFWSSADGALDFDVHDAVPPRLTLIENEGPLAIRRLSGQARLRNGKIELKDSELDSPSGKFKVSGTASLTQELDLKLSRMPISTAGGFSITGTFAEPRVAPLPGTEQARLKAEAAK